MEGTYENGIYQAPGARLSDQAGLKRLPIGNDVFRSLMRESVFMDKSLLIADVLTRGTAVTLYCRPRRFGKSLNLSMLQAFLEIENPSDWSWSPSESLFRGLQIWEAGNGQWREHLNAYPVVRFTFNDVKRLKWEDSLGAIHRLVASEFSRHGYLIDSPALDEAEQAAFLALRGGNADDKTFSSSLRFLTELLAKHHGRPAVILIDEYDAPVMAAASYGYYAEAANFLKSWLTGALKSNSALAFGVLTGVQRISKESIFSDLNNLVVDTPMSLASDERYGFTQAEVEALAHYRGQSDGIELAREWYDGYRFGTADVYNPWSTLNFFQNACAPDLYWTNTSGNGVLAELAASADPAVLDKLYQLLEPQGEIEEAVDTSVVFADTGLPAGEAVWSLLYLAGYLTTEDTELPNDNELPRRLHIPNREVHRVFRNEIVTRFSRDVGGRDRLLALHTALRDGNAERVAAELERVLVDSASHFDLTRENSYHMLVLGLLFGMRGYGDPLSNREAGYGRFDIRVAPNDPDRNPLVILELKRTKSDTPAAANLDALATEALEQARDRAYASGSPTGTAGTIIWGLAFNGKELACSCERA